LAWRNNDFTVDWHFLNSRGLLQSILDSGNWMTSTPTSSRSNK
jgi:hypothetical protein